MEFGIIPQLTGSAHVNNDLDVPLGVVAFFPVVFICGQNYTLEWFSEAGSAPIRSAVPFYFDIDVRIFSQLLQKYIATVFFNGTKMGAFSGPSPPRVHCTPEWAGGHSVHTDGFG